MAGRFSIEAVFKGTDQMSRVISQIENRTSRFASGFGASLKSIDGVNNKILGGLANITKQALAAGVALGAVTGAALYNIGKTGADFEQAITNVGAVSLSTRKEIGELESKALELGLKTKFTATEAANAMETMARAGFKNSEVLAGIPGLLAAAAAEGITPGEVTEVVAATIKGMGLAASETNRVADVFALASAKTKSSILSLGESMATVGPVAAQLGVSLEDATASVALLQDAGLDASVAGSAVSTMLTKLAKPSAEVSAQMTQFGIKFKDAKGNMLPFVDVLKNISVGAKKSGGNLDQMGFFSELAGMRGQKAALGLAKALQSGKFDELSGQLQNAAGSAEKMAGIRIDTLEGDLTLLNSSIDIVKIALFNLEGGPLRKIIQRTNEWVIANKELIATDVKAFIEKAAFGIDLFAAGAKSGFGIVRDAFAPVVWLFGVFGKHIEDSGTWPSKVQAVGEAFGFLGGVAIAFVGFAASVKIARLAVVAYEGAVVAAKVAVWAWNAASTAYTFITGGAAAVTAIHTGAQWAGRAAMIAGTIAMGARNAITWIAFAATTRFTFAQVASKLAAIAGAAITWLWNTAQAAWTATTVLATVASGSYTSATVLGTEATTAATVATDLANVSMGTFLLTLGAAAAAIGSVYAAYKQFTELLSVSGGWEGIKAGIGGVLNEGSFFKGVDDFQNEQARKDAAAATGGKGSDGSFFGPPSAPAAADSGSFGAPQVASPTQAITNSVQTNHATAEVTVKAHPGTSAAVTKKPKGGAGVTVAPSGTP